MRILILGADGMLGHKAYQRLRQRHEVYLTVRAEDTPWQHPLFAGLDRAHAYTGIDVRNADRVEDVLMKARPDAVLNCVGIIKQRDDAKSPVPSIQVNSLFPHQLADMCAAQSVPLIHISTDCVFSGRRGHYVETDAPDPADLYGLTKLLGEVNRTGCLTLRTSMIGWEIKNKYGLVEWLASQRGKRIRGFSKAVYSGLTTAALVDLIALVLERRPELWGLYHAASAPISKYELLTRLRDKLGWHDVQIEADQQFQCDRSLDGSRLASAAQWQAPQWDKMLTDLAAEWPIYEKWRNEVK